MRPWGPYVAEPKAPGPRHLRGPRPVLCCNDDSDNGNSAKPLTGWPPAAGHSSNPRFAAAARRSGAISVRDSSHKNTQQGVKLLSSAIPEKAEEAGISR